MPYPNKAFLTHFQQYFPVFLMQSVNYSQLFEFVQFFPGRGGPAIESFYDGNITWNSVNTIVSWGIGMKYALGAADELAKEGISAEVIDLRTLRPIDMATVIESVKKTNRCVTIEEAWPVASMSDFIGSEIMREAFDYLDAPVLKCTGKDVPMPYAANLEKLALTSVKEVIDAVKAVTYR